MDYTQNKEIMDVLTELADEVDGWHYSRIDGYSETSNVMQTRKKAVNENVEKLKALLLKTERS